MTSILETAMLICFGLSWPVNVIKNVRSGSAEGMSLPFILMILAGYVAGITAKIIGGHINYVLAAYFLNFAVVALDLGVYFFNRKLDRKRCAVKA